MTCRRPGGLGRRPFDRLKAMAHKMAGRQHSGGFLVDRLGRKGI